MRKNENLICSYLNMRRIIGILGLLLPLLVVVLGFVEGGFGLKGSISSYYYTNARDVYVAMLAIISIFLISYKGYERIDDVASNLSGVFALGTLAFPTYYSTDYSARVGLFLLNDRTSDIIHTSFAAGFFLSLAFSSAFLFTRSRESGSSRAKRGRNRVYRACGIVMAASILLIVVYLVFLQASGLARLKPVFFLETIALSAFGISWMLKGKTFMARKRTAREHGR